jgi:RecA/RadA recombinase
MYLMRLVAERMVEIGGTEKTGKRTAATHLVEDEPKM